MTLVSGAIAAADEAAGRKIGASEVGEAAKNRQEIVKAFVGFRSGSDEFSGVGMAGLAKESVRWCTFHEVTGMHHNNAIAIF